MLEIIGKQNNDFLYQNTYIHIGQILPKIDENFS